MNNQQTETAGKWTPGPWMNREYDDVRDGSHGLDIEAHPDFNVGLPVAVCSGPDCEANARLISAAPDLYEALEGLRIEARLYIDACPADPDSTERFERAGKDLETAIAKAQAALAKARGGAQ